jgi:dolichol-phosphate mannosyltransferase
VGETSVIQLSIIVPAVNEADNLPLLVPRIADAVKERSYEILIIDDNSQDNTPQVCAELAQRYPLHLIVRPVPRDGLSGAVLEGMKIARGEILLVMDADLQHPPEKIDELASLLERNEGDFALGSRYVTGGGTSQEWTLFRKLNSEIATFLASPFAGKTKDPMSGFFALRRATYEGAQRLTPLGYKIGLELMCKCRVKKVREVPIHFGARQHGQSKLTLKQQFKYLEHLSRLYDFTFPRASPAIKFLIATGCSWIVAFAFFAILIRLGCTIHQALVLSYPAAILTTAVFHYRYVRTQREFIIRPHPWRDFWIICLCEWLTLILAATWMSRRIVAGVYPLEAFTIAMLSATITRYILRKEFLMDIRGLRKDLRAHDAND